MKMLNIFNNGCFTWVNKGLYSVYIVEDKLHVEVEKSNIPNWCTDGAGGGSDVTLASLVAEC